MKGVKVRGKTALRWECELLYNQNYVNVMGSQLFRASGNTETDFSTLIYIAFITAWQILHVSARGVPPISMSPPECLFGPLIWGFWLKMLMRRRLRVEAPIHYPLCFGLVRWWYIFP